MNKLRVTFPLDTGRERSKEERRIATILCDQITTLVYQAGRDNQSLYVPIHTVYYSSTINSFLTLSVLVDSI